MRGLLSFILGIFLVYSYAQVQVTSNLSVYKHWKVNFSEQDSLLELSRLKNRETAPKPIMKSAQVKKKIDAKRTRSRALNKRGYITTQNDLLPSVESDFNGKPIGGAGIPNDNSMAISNDGIIVSAINTSVTILDEKGEDEPYYRSLFGITKGQLGRLDRFYDPKVTYDPIADRFILVFLEGSNSSDTRIVIGFTETNDPREDWNFYALNGKPLGGETWSDYPIIAHNAADLYVTVNLLRDNESWQEGFVESFIWQVNKADGYEGKEDLTQNLFSGITYGGAPVWSICPVQPALDFDMDNMYFLSVRPDAESNDTVFLHEITASSTTGGAEHRLTVLQTDVPYGVPPTAFQPLIDGSDFRLQTNDTRVLSATIHQGDIHYTQSTILEDEIRSGVYHGIISNVASSPTVRGDIISSPTLDYAYPSIAYAGTNAQDKHSMLLTFSHVGEDVFPGTSVIFHNKIDGFDRLYSDVVRVRDGDSVINTFVADSMERWGDYTDIQRKYNEPNIVWACGSYGDTLGRNNVWLAKLKVANELNVQLDNMLVYPNPAYSSIEVTFNFELDDIVSLRLTNMSGQVVQKVSNQEVSSGTAQFLLNTVGLSSGMYTLSIYGENEELLGAQKIIIE